MHHHLFIINADHRLLSFRYGSGKSLPGSQAFSRLNSESILADLQAFTRDYNNFISAEKKKFQGTPTFDVLKSLLETDLCAKLRPLDSRYQGSAIPLFARLLAECETIHSRSLAQGRFRSPGFFPSVSTVLSDVVQGLQSLNPSFSEPSLLADYLTNLKVLAATQQTVRDLSKELKATLQSQVDSITVSTYVSVLSIVILLVVYAVVDKKVFMRSLKTE